MINFNFDRNINKKIGIIGGGQLGKMMILSAKNLGCYVTILDPNKDCPASSICDEHIIANFNDKDAIISLANKSDVVTYEFEHIDYKTLIELLNNNKEIFPSPYSLKVIQNKYSQKTKLKENNIPVPNFKSVKNIDEIKSYANSFGYPFVLKASKGGYDGKGNLVIKNLDDIEKNINYIENISKDMFIEEFINFKLEVSILVCRSIDGNVKFYPIAQNIHKDSILHKTIVPANISKSLEEMAKSIANDIMRIFEGVGMFCIEFFVTDDDKILVNEIAPRPHNSGHFTIEGCITSQFENHIRAILNLPLGNTQLIKPSVMVNLLGEDGFKGDTYIEGIYDVLNTENAFLHIYGKKQTLPKRKMGHITIIDDDINIADKKANFIHKKIKFISK